MPPTRQLAAIMFTDIVGYTALMGKDEQKAFDILRKNRQLQKPIIEQHSGKWIKELGDGVLASFNTVSDAVQAAIQIQETCNHAKEFSLRIGIHQGEVVFEQDDIFGDAVNLASRIQALAPVGGIWVSETVHHNISNKQGIATRFVKEESLKNVKEPIKVYEVLTTNKVTTQPPFSQKEKKHTPGKTIAVLPFVNMSSDPEQEFFSDGLTEDIITDLSHLDKLLVISRSSIMTFKGTNKKIKEIAAEVNAQYVLEGSVRKAGNNLRITAQLIDAVNDVHLWAERYNGTMDDIFYIQEKVSGSIVEALNLKLITKMETPSFSHPIQNTKAYEFYIRARQEIWKRTAQGFDNAIVLAQRGLGAVGDNALLYATLGSAFLYAYRFAIKPDPAYREQAREAATKSLMLDPNCAQAHFIDGMLAFERGNMQTSASIFKKVLDLDPNNTDAMINLIITYCVSGRADAAKPIAAKMLQVDPLTPVSHVFSGVVDFYGGKIQESLPFFQNWIQLEPETPHVRFMCSWNFALNNRIEESINILDLIIKDTPALVYGRFALFLKNSLLRNKEAALKHATEELKQEAASLDYFLLNMAWGYTLIDEKDEAVWWLNKSLDFGYSPYPLILKWETFHRVLGDQPGFKMYMQEIKRRSEQFVI